MSFVPVTGPARLLAGEPPREGSVEFTDERRTIVLPIRGALPVLAKARDRRRGCTRRSRLLAAPRCSGCASSPPASSSPSEGGAGGSRRSTPTTSAASPSWRAPGPGTASTRRPPRASCAACSTPWSTRCPARPRGAHVTAAPRPRSARRRSRAAPTRSATAAERIARIRARGLDDLPQLVTLSLRVEADEEELVAGACRLVLQVHDEREPAPRLRRRRAVERARPDAVHGFGDRARTHAALALRDAADGLAAARAAARAAGARRDHARHRRAGQPARGRRRGAARARRRRAVAAQPGPRPQGDRPTLDRAAGHARGPARRGRAQRRRAVRASTGRSRCAATR